MVAVSDAIWEAAEIGYQEHKSADILINALRQEGFTVTEQVANIPTAFIGSWGEGKPVIGLLGEYDALPRLNQVAGISEKRTLCGDAPGHGCGHNMIAAGCLAGAVAAKDYMQTHNIKGTIRFYGCPAEESGAGKMFMVRDGCFDDVDACYTYHPGSCNAVLNRGNLAVMGMELHFKGVSSHAALHPQLGRSALDACELTNVGVNYLREHVPSDARMHYAYINAGGTAPNVVQETAALRYAVRAPQIKVAKEIAQRVVNVAKGAALMTDTTVDIRFTSGICDYVPNDTLGEILTQAMQAVGAPAFDDDDRAFAASFYDQYSQEEVTMSMKHIVKNCYPNWKDLVQVPLIEEVAPYRPSDARGMGSTDVGDVSYKVPTAQSRVTTYANGTPNHSWQVTAQVKSPLVSKTLATVGESLALASIITMESPELLAKAHAEFVEKTGGDYTCPVDCDVPPPIPSP